MVLPFLAIFRLIFIIIIVSCRLRLVIAFSLPPTSRRLSATIWLLTLSCLDRLHVIDSCDRVDIRTDIVQRVENRLAGLLGNLAEIFLPLSRRGVLRATLDADLFALGD